MHNIPKNIVTKENNYRRLFPGEYVSFDLGSYGDKTNVCVNVSGIHGGPLLSDNTVYRYRIHRIPQRNDDDDETGENENENEND